MRRRVIIVIALLVAVAVLASAPEWINDYVILVGFQVFQLAALAQAWSLLAGYGGVVSLAVSAFVGTGAYAVAKFSAVAGLGVFPCLLLAGIVAVVLALIVSVPLLRFRGLYFTIATLVLAVGLGAFIAINDVLNSNQGIVVSGATPSTYDVYRISLVVVLLTTLGVWWIGGHRLGLGLRAIRDDEDVAARMGVPVFRTKLIGFVFGAFVMGVVGGIQAYRVVFVQPSGAFNFNWTIDTVNAAIIGGVGTVLGPLIGALIAVVLAQALSDFTQLHLVITGVILILVIRLAPAGLWGSIARAIDRRRRRLAPARVVPPRDSDGPVAGDAERLEPGQPLLSVTDLGKTFGGVPAIEGVSLEIRSGEVLGIVGPNGAGKSTLIGLLSGAIRGVGSVHFIGQDVTDRDARARAHLGIGRTHQVPRPFEQLTVLENLMVARRHRRQASAREDTAGCLEILDRCGLLEFADTPASELGLLRLKRLELARALALRPRVLLLDEIGAGLIKSELNELIDLINDLRSEVESIVVVEHVLDLIRRCCDRLIVVNRGTLLVEGDPATVLADERVAEVYLGTASETVPKASGRSTITGDPLLDVRGITAQYGKHVAVHDVSLSVGKGEILSLLGANGAGKSTVAKALGGSLGITAGEFRFKGERVDGKPTFELVRRGIAHCMEGRRIFADLSVEENLLLGGRGAAPAERRHRLAEVYELFPDLQEKRGNSGAGLSGGQQQMLAIGRALMSAPDLVIFDEISLGLAPITVDRLYEALRTINRARGLSMIIIEQNVERGLALADRVVVLEKGTVALSGTPDEIRTNPHLRSLYVG